MMEKIFALPSGLTGKMEETGSSLLRQLFGNCNAFSSGLTGVHECRETAHGRRPGVPDLLASLDAGDSSGRLTALRNHLLLAFSVPGGEMTKRTSLSCP